MSNIILPVIGGVAGFAIGGPVGMLVGANLGMAAGNLLFPQHSNVQLPTQTGPRVTDLRVQVSSYGKFIPLAYGRQRLAGNVIWARDIKEVRQESTTTQEAGGKGGGGQTVSQTSVTYQYYATLAIAICEGPIDGIRTIWADSKMLTKEFLGAAQGRYNIYLGTEDQEADPIMESYMGVGNVPAYRGMAYVVIEDFPLADYGNRIPNFTFEIQRTVRMQPAVEDRVKDIVLIPGAGEFVYSNVTHIKETGVMTDGGELFASHKIALNMHNYESRPNALVALDDLEATFPNLEWVAVVVTWFATSTDAGECEIIPKVEFDGTSTIVTPTDWEVAGYTRETAEQVLIFDDGKPTYGGTPSDDTVIQMCQALKAKGYKVMLYPMPFVDMIEPEPKPWRGRITPATAGDANGFFTKTNGFNAFVRHYSQLTVGGVHIKTLIDAFVIGSEMVGMTGFTDTPGNYPAVNQLVSLAALVKADLGSGVKITYAADWSEYHSKDGWFNLDPLWTSTAIDMVGIDAYFPLTDDITQRQITEAKIKEGWESGEGWEYFWNSDRTVKTNYSSPVYAWKNVEYWWSHTHTNPNASGTGWTPKMKQLWFTEFGFPSVDAAANQPNVFYDPTSSESFFPRGSRGRVDFQAQREAINATLEFLQARNAESGNSGLVPSAFLWTWDARPFPYWPDYLQIWKDGILWRTGHWVNGKLGQSSLGAIVADLLKRVQLSSDMHDVTRLTDRVEGYVILSAMSVRDAIEQLAAAYFFDCVESDGLLKFVKRGGLSLVTVPEDDLVPLGDSADIRQTINIVYGQELELPQRVNVTYLSRLFDYDNMTQSAQRQTTQAVDQVSFNLPIVMTDQEAKTIAEVTLYNSWIQRTSYKLQLPTKYCRVEPTDIITVTVNNVGHLMRVTKATTDRNGLVQVEALAEDVSTYDFYIAPGERVGAGEPPIILPETMLRLLDIPALPTDTDAIGQLRIAVAGDATWRGAVIYRSDDGGEEGGNNWQALAAMQSASTMGIAVNAVPAGTLNVFDLITQIDVFLVSGMLASVSEFAVLNGANVAIVGDEIIQFQNAILTGDNRYTLSKLLRGRLGTEHAIGSHIAGDPFILLTPSLSKIAMPNQLIGLQRHYKAVSVGKTLGNTPEEAFTYQAKALKPYAPVHITGSRSDGDLTIRWIRRTRLDGEWRDGVDVPLGETAESYEVDILNGTTIKRTLSSTIPTVTYTAGQQVEDFGSVQGMVNVRIYQLSAVVGRGYGSEKSL